MKDVEERKKIRENLEFMFDDEPGKWFSEHNIAFFLGEEAVEICEEMVREGRLNKTLGDDTFYAYKEIRS